MIRIPFDNDRISHGHFVHPLELAHLIHFWDNRQDIQRDQHEALTTVSEQLRRLSPLVAELVSNTQPEHPFQHVVPQITSILAQFRQELDARLLDTHQTFQPIPTPHIPFDACGRMRGPQDCYPAPILRKHVYPRTSQKTTSNLESFGDCELPFSAAQLDHWNILALEKIWNRP